MPDVFLLHFEEPYHHARHYAGYAIGTGRGSSYAKAIADCTAIGPHELVQAVQWSGIAIHVADVLVGEGRATQRRLRSSHNLSRHCPICVREAESS
jgi:hypothetical protein